MKAFTSAFKALSDLTRIRALRSLIAGGPVCVCELADALQLPRYPGIKAPGSPERRAWSRIRELNVGLLLYRRQASHFGPPVRAW